MSQHKPIPWRPNTFNEGFPETHHHKPDSASGARHQRDSRSDADGADRRAGPSSDRPEALARQPEPVTAVVAELFDSPRTADEQQSTEIASRQPLRSVPGVSRRWLPAKLFDTVHRLRGAHGNGLDHARSLTAVLDAPTASLNSDDPPLVPFANERSEANVVLVVVLGLGPAELGRIIELVNSQSAAGRVVPIFLTDADDFQPFRKRRLLFEYLPPRSDAARFAANLDWDLYRQRRLALIRRKWQPGRIVAFGSVASEVLAVWRESPFEDPTIAQVIAGGNGSPAKYP